MGKLGLALSSVELCPPRMIVKIPIKVSPIIKTSNLRMVSLSIMNARMTTITGATLEKMDMMVAGMNMVTEYLMILVVTPVKVLKASGPDLLHSIVSHVSFFNLKFN